MEIKVDLHRLHYLIKEHVPVIKIQPFFLISNLEKHLSVIKNIISNSLNFFILISQPDMYALSSPFLILNIRKQSQESRGGEIHYKAGTLYVTPLYIFIISIFL